MGGVFSAIGSWLMKNLVGIVLSWITAKIPELLNMLFSAVVAYFKNKKKDKETEETKEKYEAIVEAGKDATREERKDALEDALNAPGK